MQVSKATGKITEYAGKIADLTEQVAKKAAEAAEFKELWQGVSATVRVPLTEVGKRLCSACRPLM